MKALLAVHLFVGLLDSVGTVAPPAVADLSSDTVRATVSIIITYYLPLLPTAPLLCFLTTSIGDIHNIVVVVVVVVGGGGGGTYELWGTDTVILSLLPSSPPPSSSLLLLLFPSPPTSSLLLPP